MDAPAHVGFVVLQYAKLRMLEFYYDFMDRYVVLLYLGKTNFSYHTIATLTL